MQAELAKVEYFYVKLEVILSDDDKMLSIDDYNDLIAKTDDTAEISLYTLIFNYLLGLKQAEVVKNAKF